jgi:predicted acyltransferase (DUF342 family)
MKKSLVAGAMLLASASMLSGCVIHIGDASAMEGSDFSSILGNIDIAEGKHAGDISSVNGNVEISDHAGADDVSIVNGNLEMESHVTVRSIDIVNGDISATSHLSVLGNVESVNGNITLPEQSKIGGHVETVNGDITATDTVVEEDVETLNGDITLKGNTHIIGNIIYRESESSWGERSDNKPTLTIESDVIIDGTIILERPVNLVFDNDAFDKKVVVSYSGAQ